MDYVVAVYFRGAYGYSDSSYSRYAGSKEYATELFNDVCNKYINMYNMDIYSYKKDNNKFAIYDKFGYEIMKVILDTYEKHYKNWNW